MSSSPTRYQAATSPTAEIRSQAIAKLKRAASIPRTPDGRRGLVVGGVGGLSSSTTSEEGHGAGSSASGHSHSSAATPSPSRLHYDYDEEEQLLAGPEMNVFDATSMQRTLSESSSFHIPTPPHMAYGSSSTTSLITDQTSPVHPGSDWPPTVPYPLNMQGLSPVSVPPSAFPASLHTPTGPGRNTPSPLLPSLTDLRNLSRSNSAAARAKAMCKLTGQPETPTRSTNIPTPMSSDEDVRFGFHGHPGSRLTRSGTIGVPRMFGLSPSPSVSTMSTVDDTAAILPAAPIPDTAFDVPRPRLQRSFTVSSSNMGEERRSAVGRRMVERLAERRAARQTEETEVRKLWEERRKQAELRKSNDTWSSRHKSLAGSGQDPAMTRNQALDVPEAADDEDEDQLLGSSTNDGDWEQDDNAFDDEDEDEPLRPTAHSTTASNIPFIALPPIPPQPASFLAAASPDRTPSRSTERSDEFEYEAHLRRSLSSRTARNDMETSPEVALPSPLIEDASEDANSEGVFLRHQQNTASNYSNLSSVGHSNVSSLGHSVQSNHGHMSHEDLALPLQPFVTATRHITQESVSSSGTAVPPHRSPGADSTSTFEPTPMPQVNLPENSNDWSGKRASPSGSQTSAYDSPVAQTHKAYPHIESANRTRSDSPARHAQQDSISNTSTTSAQDRAVSRMSWDDVSHDEVPQGKKSGSITSKKGRTMLAALRKHSTASQTASPPASPRHAFTQMFARRESESSATPSQRSNRDSPVNSRGIMHQASNGSLSAAEGATTANNLLIQHQLSSSHSSSTMGFLPRADPKDPRVMNSKLSPFPGINVSRSRSGSESQGNDMPALVHHHSEQGHARPINGSHVTNGSSERPRQSDDNSSGGSGRRNWLGGKPVPPSRTSGATSDSHSRQGSNSSHLSQPSHCHHSPHSRSQSHQSNHSDDYRNGNSRVTESPVDLLSKERGVGTGTAGTRDIRDLNSQKRADIASFMVNRRRAPPPPIELGSSNVVSINDDAKMGALAALPHKSTEVLTRMDKMLSRGSGDPSHPDFLDDPPRKLLLAQQVLQVVNVHTVKDRYLFLFNDILVIAKPVITSGTQANLDMKYIVKSVVSLDKLSVTGLNEDPTQDPPRHPAVTSFIQHFAQDGYSAVRNLVDRSSPKIDSVTLASLLFKTPELDKTQLGLLLAADTMLLRAYMDRFRFDHVRIDDALRMFLLAIRLPTDISAAETLLCGFADGYYETNADIVPYDPVRARDLVLATLELNDMLYSTFGFAFPNHAISADTFVSAFRSKDPNRLVPDELLEDIYTSIRSSKLVQALASHEAHLAREVTLKPARLPPKLTFNEWSDPITITLPRSDPSFKINLLGEGLEFNPPTLDFSRNKEQGFRVRGVSLGIKSMLLDRVGASAAYYASLGNTRTFAIERAFMRNTFHVQFTSPFGARRKYCFSVPDVTARQKWGAMLTRQVWLTTEKKQGAGIPTNTEQRIRRAAEAVSLQVLRDALLPHESKPEEPGSRKASLAREAQRINRVGSVSVAYAAKAAEEAKLGPLQPTRANGSDSVTGIVELQTGKELVLLCRQNSLLPSVLELLQAGKEAGSNGAGSGGLNGHGRVPSDGIPHSAQMAGEKPLRSAGLKALMHDRRL